MRLGPLLFLTVGLWLGATLARADSDPRDQAALIGAAEVAEREQDFARALELYRAAAAKHPGSRLAGRAQARVRYYETLGQGGFVPLRALETLRKRGSPTLEEVQAFDAKVGSFPEGSLRREARILVAESYFRLEQPLLARAAYERVLAEPNLDDAEFLLATNGVALAKARIGDLRGSLETLRNAGLGASADAAHVELSMVRRFAEPLSWAVIAGFVLTALALGRRGLPRVLRDAKPRLLGLVSLLALTLGFPLGLASMHRSETWDAMVLLVPASGLLAVFAWLMAPSVARGPRRWLAVLGALAQLAVAYLALDAAETLLGFWISWKIA